MARRNRGGDHKRKPGNIAARHWEAIAVDAGLNPRQLRLRVQELIEGIVHHGHAVTRELAENPSEPQAMASSFVNMA